MDTAQLPFIEFRKNTVHMGGATINGSFVPKTEGGITIPFTAEYTAVPGTFFRKFLVELLSAKTSFPSSGNIRAKINKAP